MFSSVKSVALLGINGIITNVEVDIRNGLPSFCMVGFLSTQVKEAGERVRAAILNSNFNIEPKKIVINISPADLKKDGTSFDLAIAIAILQNQLGFDEEYLSSSIFIGELSLNGDVKEITGILPMVTAAKDAGIRRIFLPIKNLKEAKLVEEIEVIAVSDLSDTIKKILEKKDRIPYFEEEETYEEDNNSNDFAFVHGQGITKRAIEIAVSGMHNLLMIGEAGSGKSMMASCIPSIMPPMSKEESLELTKIYSISGLLKGSSLIKKRPFRAPHHSISIPALAGGGTKIRAGEISLSHNGVLFLDELPEFSSQTIEILRQPLEEKKITIGRAIGTVTYPANFLLVAAMNPCKCGFYPNRKFCHCNETKVRNYLSRVSRPLVDRFDIVSEIRRIPFESVLGIKRKEETSSDIRKRVCIAREIQENRFKSEGIHFNSQMDSKMTENFCKIDSKTKKLLEEAYKKINLSLRGYYRILKVARTISDLYEKDDVTELEVSEAIHYRELIERFW